MIETGRVSRREYVAALIAEIPDALIITGLGSPTYDVYAAGHRPQNFYLWGAMGAAVPVALGLALAQPERSVVAVTGDGEHLMGIGALATIGAARPSNLTVVVLDNAHFGETGMQRSHTGLGTDLRAIARGFGIETVIQVASLADVSPVADRVTSRKGTTYVHVLIHADEPPRALPPRDGVANKNAFRAALGLPTF